MKILPLKLLLLNDLQQLATQKLVVVVVSLPQKVIPLKRFQCHNNKQQQAAEMMH